MTEYKLFELLHRVFNSNMNKGIKNKKTQVNLKMVKIVTKILESLPYIVTPTSHAESFSALHYCSI